MKLEIQCPKCKNNVFNEPSALDLDDEISCAACSHSAKLSDFLTVGAKADALEAGKQALIKALSDVPGFKMK